MLWRVTAVLFVCLFATIAPARAQGFQPCPYVTASWGRQYPPPITSTLYSLDTQILYVIFNNTTASAFSNVPQTIVQSLSSTTNVVAFYNSFILPSYHALLLSSPANCPVLNENGAYLWTD